MPDYEKSWTLSWDVDVTGASAVLTGAGWAIALKDLLLDTAEADGGEWTIEGCSDGSAVDATDRWGSDTSKVVWDSAGQPHSWIELSKTYRGTTWYLIIDCANTDGETLTVVYSHTAPSTGGTTTNRPTTAGASAYTYTDQCISHVGGQTMYFHGSRNEDGGFLVSSGRTGLDKLPLNMVFATLETTRTNLADPYAVWFGLKYNEADTYGPWELNDSSNGMADDTNFGMFDETGATDADGFESCPGYTAHTHITTNQSACAQFPIGGDAVDGSWPTLPVHVFNGDAGQYSLRGRWADVWQTSLQSQLGGAPTGGPFTHIVTGWVGIPSDTEPTH